MFEQSGNNEGDSNLPLSTHFIAGAQTPPLNEGEQETAEHKPKLTPKTPRGRSTDPNKPLSAQQLRLLRETPEERERRLIAGRERMRLYRLKERTNESDEARQKRLQQARERTRIGRLQENSDQGFSFIASNVSTTTAWSREVQNDEQSIDESAQVQNVGSSHTPSSDGSTDIALVSHFIAGTEALPLNVGEQGDGEEPAPKSTPAKRRRRSSCNSDAPMSAQQLRLLRETPEERERRLVAGRERMRMYRLKERSHETEEARQKRLQQARERTRIGRLQETPEQREARLRKTRDRLRLRRQMETPEEREQRLRMHRDKKRERYNKMSPVERSALRRKDRRKGHDDDNSGSSWIDQVRVREFDPNAVSVKVEIDEPLPPDRVTMTTYRRAVAPPAYEPLPNNLQQLPNGMHQLHQHQPHQQHPQQQQQQQQQHPSSLYALNLSANNGSGVKTVKAGNEINGMMYSTQCVYTNNVSGDLSLTNASANAAYYTNGHHNNNNKIMQQVIQQQHTTSPLPANNDSTLNLVKNDRIATNPILTSTPKAANYSSNFLTDYSGGASHNLVSGQPQPQPQQQSLNAYLQTPRSSLPSLPPLSSHTVYSTPTPTLPTSYPPTYSHTTTHTTQPTSQHQFILQPNASVYPGTIFSST